MHAALGRPHVVGKAHHELVVAVVVLHGDLRTGVPLGARHIDHVLKDGCLVPVGPADELPDAALEAHDVLFFLLFPVIGNGNGKTGVQEGLFPHPLVENFVVVNKGVEHLGVRLEGDLRAGVVRLTHDLHFLGDVAPGELHFIDVAVFMHPHPQPLGQGIDHRRAHAVQAAGDLVSSAAELTAGVQHGIHDLQCGPPGLGLDIHGDTAAVIGNGDGIAGIDGHGNMLAVSGQCLINGVVHDFVDQMMQTGGRRGADIHTGPLADCFQPFQHLDLLRAIFLSHFCFVRHVVLHFLTFCVDNTLSCYI